MRLCFAGIAFLCAVLARTELTPEDERLLRCAQGEADCAALLNEEPPATFQTLFTTHAGGRFVVHTVSAWSPPHAKRFYALVRLKYFTGRCLSEHVWLGLTALTRASGAPFYRVLRDESDPSHGGDFVAQFGYRGVPQVDLAWVELQTSYETAPVLAPQGNHRGTVAFGTGSIPRNASTPYCTADDCSYGFSVELFVNTGTNNGRLDFADFSPFGYIIDCSELGVLDNVYAGYGELEELCSGEVSSVAGSRYCMKKDVGGWAGVNLGEMLRGGREYLNAKFPLLDSVASVELLEGEEEAEKGCAALSRRSYAAAA